MLHAFVHYEHAAGGNGDIARQTRVRTEAKLCTGSDGDIHFRIRIVPIVFVEVAGGTRSRGRANCVNGIRADQRNCAGFYFKSARVVLQIRINAVQRPR